MRVPRRVLPLLVLAASLQALWPVARGGAQTTEADVHVAQAIIAIDERRYDAALAELKRALEIEPDHVEALYYTGVVYAAQRRPDLAVPFLEKARAKAPADPPSGCATRSWRRARRSGACRSTRAWASFTTTTCASCRARTAASRSWRTSDARATPPRASSLPSARTTCGGGRRTGSRRWATRSSRRTTTTSRGSASSTTS